MPTKLDTSRFGYRGGSHCGCSIRIGKYRKTYTTAFSADTEKHAEERKREYVSSMTLHAPQSTDMFCICI